MCYTCGNAGFRAILRGDGICAKYGGVCGSVLMMWIMRSQEHRSQGERCSGVFAHTDGWLSVDPNFKCKTAQQRIETICKKNECIIPHRKIYKARRGENKQRRNDTATCVEDCTFRVRGHTPRKTEGQSAFR